MKIWSFMNVWNEADWLLWHLCHVYPYVDHVLLTEGNNGPPGLWNPRSEDGTLEMVKLLDKELRRFTYVGDGVVNDNNCVGQAETFNKMNRVALDIGMEPGEDWIFLGDVDEFHPQSFMEEMRDIIFHHPHIDAIHTWGPMYFFDFNTYIWQERERLWKVRPDDCGYWRETVKYCDTIMGHVDESPHANVLRLKDKITNHHYAFLKPAGREYIRRKQEVLAGFRDEKALIWYQEVFMKWSQEDKGDQAYKNNIALTGNSGILFNGNDKILLGEFDQPFWVEKHPFTMIFKEGKDIRDIEESKLRINDKGAIDYGIKYNGKWGYWGLGQLVDYLKECDQ